MEASSKNGLSWPSNFRPFAVRRRARCVASIPCPISKPRRRQRMHHPRRSNSIMHRRHALFVRAMSATIQIAPRLDPMADYFAAAMLAFRRQRVNRAFKTIEVSRDAVVYNFQRLVVLVSTDFTLHNGLLSNCFSRFLIALDAFARRAGHLIMLGILDAFLDKLFGEGLLIRSGDFRRFFAHRFTHRLPSIFFRQRFRSRR